MEKRGEWPTAVAGKIQGRGVEQFAMPLRIQFYCTIKCCSCKEGAATPTSRIRPTHTFER